MCVCACVPPEASETARHITTFPPPTQRAMPGELHKLLFKHVRRTDQEKSLLKVSCWLRFDGHAFSVTLPVMLGRI